MIRLTDRQGNDLLRVFEAFRAVAPQTEVEADLSRVLSEQLSAPRHFDDLVDTIVKVVTDPRRSSLNQGHLEVLRRAILSPVEMTRFQALMNKVQGCGGCGCEFSDFEAVTIADNELRCYSCAHAEYVTCRSCKGRVGVSGIDKTIGRALQRHTCQPADQRSAVEVPVLPRSSGVGVAGAVPSSSRWYFTTTAQQAASLLEPSQPIRSARRIEELSNG